VAAHTGGIEVNKAQLVDALAQRLGDKRTAGAAVDGLLDVIVRTVQKGEKVNIAGFGVFEKRARAARVARNPRTGEAVKVRKTTVPAFRAGSTFKDVISGAKKLPRVAAKTATTTGNGATKPATIGGAATKTARVTAGAATTAAAKTAAETGSRTSATVSGSTAKPAAAKPAGKTPTRSAPKAAPSKTTKTTKTTKK
jgi:DNA-binding protein HU-beta